MHLYSTRSPLTRELVRILSFYANNEPIFLGGD